MTELTKDLVRGAVAARDVALDSPLDLRHGKEAGATAIGTRIRATRGFGDRRSTVVSKSTPGNERHRGRIGYRHGSRASSPTPCASEGCVRQAREVVGEILVRMKRPPHRDGRVFHGPSGGILKPDTVRNILEREVLVPLAKRFPAPPGGQGMADGRLHSFRHYFCSTSANAGVIKLFLICSQIACHLTGASRCSSDRLPASVSGPTRAASFHA